MCVVFKTVLGVMLQRLDLAVNKSCDGVDPSNIEVCVLLFFFKFRVLSLLKIQKSSPILFEQAPISCGVPAFFLFHPRLMSYALTCPRYLANKEAVPVLNTVGTKNRKLFFLAFFSIILASSLSGQVFAVEGSGLNITAESQVAYNMWLADEVLYHV